MIKAFKFKLYPNRAQAERLNQTLDTCRHLYNAALEQRRTAYRVCRKSVSVSQQMAELPDLKRECPEVGEVYSQVLQDVLWRVEKAFAGFFRRVQVQNGRAGYPRFKSYKRYDSFTYPQFGFSLAEGRLELSKIGHLKIKLYRPLEGRVKTCTLKREIDEWFVILTCELPDPLPVIPQIEVGLDVGLESFVVTSEGESISNPRYLQSSLKQLRRAQRALSRKKRNSQRREKARLRVAKLHRKIAHQRRDFQHQTARRLVNRFDALYIEDLNVGGMIQNHHLARSIADVGWASFANILESKAAEAGKQVIRVDPNRTSQVCSGCGAMVQKDLSVRWHQCPDCGLSLHRDHNAARNILLNGQRQGHCRQAVTAPLGAVA